MMGIAHGRLGPRPATVVMAAHANGRGLRQMVTDSPQRDLRSSPWRISLSTPSAAARPGPPRAMSSPPPPRTPPRAAGRTPGRTPRRPPLASRSPSRPRCPPPQGTATIWSGQADFGDGHARALFPRRRRRTRRPGPSPASLIGQVTRAGPPHPGPRRHRARPPHSPQLFSRISNPRLRSRLHSASVYLDPPPPRGAGLARRSQARTDRLHARPCR